ncbi:MAG: GNAT family protein [bacterium]|nr:GNAT family protein [bacterium]MDZ4247816.1 GNAT family protein [Patescibacteria group bacterium]
MSRVEEPKEQERPPEFPELETPRLRLRDIRPTDAENFFEFSEDPEMADYFGSSNHYKSEIATRERIKERIEKQIGFKPGRYSWIVESRESEKFLGEVGLHSIDLKNQSGELARGLVAEARGKGFGAEAARAVLDFAFGALGLNRVQAMTRTTNARSQRSLEALGFSREGKLRQYWIVDDEPATVYMYSLLRSEYEKETT